MTERSETADGRAGSVFAVDASAPVKETRHGRGLRDMTYSMLALIIPIAIMLGLYRLLGGESPTVINTAPAFADARARATFQVLEPARLPAGWQAVSAKSDKTNNHLFLRVGYTGPDGMFLQLTESSAEPATVLGAALGADPATSPAVGSVEIDGKTWQWYKGAEDAMALVLLQPERTVVLAGRADEATLTGLVALLR